MTPEKVKISTNKLFSKILQQPARTFKHALHASGWVVSNVTSTEDCNSTVLALCDENDAIISAVFVSPAKVELIIQQTKLPAEAFEKTLLVDAIWIAPQVNTTRALPVSLYFALRYGRMQGMTNVVSFVPHPSNQLPVESVLELKPLTGVPAISKGGADYVLAAQRIKYSMIKLEEQFAEQDRALMPEYYVDEVVTTYKMWLTEFYRGSWARSILEERISKEQYIWSLFNLHQYVKWTTRLCARCIAHADDITIRNHYIYHLKGEINHEILIEKDLAYLDADVTYLKERHIPTVETNEFISIQESTIGFKQDSALMLACPFVAEGMTAHMDHNFIMHLNKTISSWGLAEPEKASKFLSSHMHFDGGEDGHWKAVKSLFIYFITDEYQLQRFLCTLTTAMNGFARGFNSVIDEMKLWEHGSLKETV